MIFSERGCNYPQPEYALWWLTQFRRWGMVEGKPDYEGVAKQVMRPDLYEEAMKELGVAHGGRSDAPETLFDGVTFDPKDPEKYATSFAVHALKELITEPACRGRTERTGRARSCIDDDGPLRESSRPRGVALLRGLAVLIALGAASATWTEPARLRPRHWEVSRPYIFEPFEKRGELDQGILRFTWYSLERVAKGYALAIAARDADRLPPRACRSCSASTLRSHHPDPAARSRRWRGCRSASCCSRSPSRPASSPSRCARCGRRS